MWSDRAKNAPREKLFQKKKNCRHTFVVILKLATVQI